MLEPVESLLILLRVPNNDRGLSILILSSSSVASLKTVIMLETGPSAEEFDTLNVPSSIVVLM